MTVEFRFRHLSSHLMHDIVCSGRWNL